MGTIKNSHNYTVSNCMILFLEDIQIIHGISLHFFKPHISKICNSFSLYIYIYESSILQMLELV